MVYPDKGRKVDELDVLSVGLSNHGFKGRVVCLQIKTVVYNLHWRGWHEVESGEEYGPGSRRDHVNFIDGLETVLGYESIQGCQGCRFGGDPNPRMGYFMEEKGMRELNRHRITGLGQWNSTKTVPGVMGIGFVNSGLEENSIEWVEEGEGVTAVCVGEEWLCCEGCVRRRRRYWASRPQVREEEGGGWLGGERGGTVWRVVRRRARSTHAVCVGEEWVWCRASKCGRLYVGEGMERCAPSTQRLGIETTSERGGGSGENGGMAQNVRAGVSRSRQAIIKHKSRDRLTWTRRGHGRKGSVENEDGDKGI
ncbi:hypothetical protein L226DRAFT_588435 [Lentinus tigrinus ALCF2SS1-7]|uniref:uncharacterized protein n=1 Tax=Lentinus tigrinus ALCF2SS1-7 TaxID=1328758 RepID=UPI001165F93C|nr:hypothetical protein L226DRAFT_588435 [Lentinus tigrinus ALCF2SS1-7]